VGKDILGILRLLLTRSSLGVRSGRQGITFCVKTQIV
jgi:hypothetical protein